MKLVKLLGVLVTAMAVVALAIVIAPSVSGRFDTRLRAQNGPDRAVSILAGRGADIGVFVRDEDAGVTVDQVRPDSPAAKAGLQRHDVIVEFDGERVRSARQFSRLVQETVAGRTVNATVLRDRERKELQVTVSGGRRGDLFGDLADRLPPMNFNFDFDLPEIGSGRRLGITVQELTDQLSAFFGAKNGVLVAAVTDGTPAARAGLRAGDIITSIDGTRVDSRQDLVRALRDASGDQVEIGIVRDKRDSTVKATVEPARRRGSRGARL